MFTTGGDGGEAPLSSLLYYQHCAPRKADTPDDYPSLVPSSLLTWTEEQWEGGLRTVGGSMLPLLRKLGDKVLAQLPGALFEM